MMLRSVIWSAQWYIAVTAAVTAHLVCDITNRAYIPTQPYLAAMREACWVSMHQAFIITLYVSHFSQPKTLSKSAMFSPSHRFQSS
jgi:hypothetical protein